MDITKGGWNFFKRPPSLIACKVLLYLSGLYTGFSLCMLVFSAINQESLFIPGGLLLGGVSTSVGAFFTLQTLERLEHSA